ncbi:MAG: MotA/TolQ/ExbB proton channel family protein [Phycisphaeraceae bacterium]|nr:MotA/TolQ/ExbB proton channel family protein [Phycisphaeraceae bacterium]
MYFKYACSHCGKTLKVSEEHAGRKARCPYCHNTVQVPAAPKATEPPLDLADMDASRLETGTATRPTGKPGSPAGLPAAAASGAATPAAPGKDKADAKAPGKPEDKSGKGKNAESDDNGSDVSMVWTSLLGLVLTILFYVLMFVLPKNYYSELFISRGWVPYVETFFMWWAIFILVAKIRKLDKQRDFMLFDLLPTELADEITPDNVDLFIKNVQGLPLGNTYSFLANRVLRGLQHFRVRKNNSEVASLMSAQSDLDANAVVGSYMMIKFSIWAIPILGFIGTVIGIGQAVAGFSGALEAADDMSKLKESLKSVSGGLSTAFDTTLVALVMAFGLKLVADWLSKKEDGLLGWVDEYCNENVLKRLNDAGQVDAGTAESVKQIRKAVDAAFVPHQAELLSWGKKLELLGTSLSDRIAQSWERIHQDLQAKHGDNMEVVSRAITTISAKQTASMQQINTVQDALTKMQSEQVQRLEEVGNVIIAQADGVAQRAQEHQEAIVKLSSQFQQQMAGQTDQLRQQQSELLQAMMQQQLQAMDERMAQHQGLVEQNLGKLVEVIGGALGGMTDQAVAGQQQIAQQMNAAADNIKQYFTALETGLASLNGVLEKLGQQNVVIEAKIEQPRRGWFFGGKR